MLLELVSIIGKKKKKEKNKETQLIIVESLRLNFTNWIFLWGHFENEM